LSTITISSANPDREVRHSAIFRISFLVIRMTEIDGIIKNKRVKKLKKHVVIKVCSNS
jgi:hypothetical protein